MLNLDFSNVSDSNEPLPEDDYTFIVTDAKVAEAKSGGSTNLILKIEVVNGDFAGRSFPHYINIQESTMWKVKSFFAAITGDPDIESIELNDPGDLVGETFIGTVEQNGKYSNVVAYDAA